MITFLSSLFVRLVKTAAVLLGLLIVAVAALGYLLAGPSERIPRVIYNPDKVLFRAPQPDLPEKTLRVMTLNLAHGRGDSIYRMVSSRKQAHANLTKTAALIERNDPHVVALQEVDVTSFISGRFNHLKELTRLSGMNYALHGEHVTMKELSYGTGLLSEVNLEKPYSKTFDPTPMRLTKGFVVATIPWPGAPSVRVDIVSVHFDFLLSSNRNQQAAAMADLLEQRRNPVIVMGDLNSDWEADSSVVKRLTQRLQLKAYQPEKDQTATFPTTGKRIDWILISNEFEFLRHQVLTEKVSDHLAVVADIRLIQKHHPEN